MYDANDRAQTEERGVNIDGTVDVTTFYDYDATQQTSKTVFDNSAQANVSQAAFTYDLQGRLHTATITSFTGGTESRIERTTYDYDATGIRVSALHEIDTDANGTWDTTTRTEYLVDHRNFTGYQQVIKETVYDDQGNVVKTIEYNFGHDEISQTVTQFDAAGQVTAKHTEIFGHDGHGSVKVLYDAAATILQVFTYEAYGQMLAIHNATAALVGTTAAAVLTSLLYSGEQFDSRIGQQYLRARYYDPNTGRFNRLDPFAGNSQDPQSFHKYLYTHGNPVMGIDPSGLQFSVAGLGVSMMVGAVVGGLVGAGIGYAYTGTLRGALTGALYGAAAGALIFGLAYSGAWYFGLQGVGRFFYDPRAFATFSRQYWARFGPANGASLHHWLIPQRWTWVPQGVRNAGFNMLHLPKILPGNLGLNQWMGFALRWGGYRAVVAFSVENGIRVLIPVSISASAGVGAWISNEREEEAIDLGGGAVAVPLELNKQEREALEEDLERRLQQELDAP